jgi:AAA domain
MEARYSAALDNKFAPLAIAAGLDPKHLPVSYEKDAPDLLTKEGLAAFIEQLKGIDKRMREQYGVPLRLVIIDTFGQTFTLKDENSASDVSRATKAMKQIASALGITVVAVHHYGKDEKADMRGSSALRGNVDFILAVKKKGQLELDRVKDARPGALGYFDMETVEVGEKRNGKPVTSLYVNARPVEEWPDEELLNVEPPRSEVVFEQSVAAMLEAKGVEQAPNGEGTPCRMVRLEDVRLEFGRLWGQSDETNRQAFHRVRKKLPAGYQIDKWDCCEWLWRSPAT